ncbi:IS30 family transposase (plasmid) [Fusobacteria bacterium ZRK30]|nr:IS30 family transposase [Fusobacteria bacterium ZRK30]
MNHKHFTIEERESIFKFLAQKKSISFIAAKLKKNRVSIYREINRNSVDGEYTPNKKMIEERSEEANDRSEIGHFESDTIVGAGKKGAMMTYVDRKSRYLVAELMINRKSDTFNEATIENFKYIPKEYIKTFTSDNGKEFSKFKELEEALGIKAYFANPYHSWERGTNENTNGLLRRTFPKGTIFSKIKRCEFYKAVNKINNRPRKCLNWKTPKEVFWGEIEKCCI